MKPSTYTPISTSRGSGPDVSTVQTLTPPKGTSAFQISVETTNARVTLDGTDPSAASAPSNVYPKDVAPQLVLCGSDCVVKWVSTAAAASVVQITWLR